MGRLQASSEGFRTRALLAGAIGTGVSRHDVQSWVAELARTGGCETITLGVEPDYYVEDSNIEEVCVCVCADRCTISFSL